MDANAFWEKWIPQGTYIFVNDNWERLAEAKEMFISDLQKLKSPKPVEGLEELDEAALKKALTDVHFYKIDANGKKIVGYWDNLAKFICSHFGTPKVIKSDEQAKPQVEGNKVFNCPRCFSSIEIKPFGTPKVVSKEILEKMKRSLSGIEHRALADIAYNQALQDIIDLIDNSDVIAQLTLPAKEGKEGECK